MGTNRGKEFESIIKKACEKVDNTYVLRLYDSMSGYKSIANPCDFVIYNNPNLFLLECKSCYGASLPFSNISEFQWESLLKASSIKGIISGFMIWFIDKDVTVFVPASNMDIYAKTKESKSFSYKDAEEYGYIIPGIKKKIFFDYDLKQFLEGNYANTNL